MDLNGDGFKDILSGGGGAVYLFEANPDGTFSERREILDPNYGIPGEDPLYDPYETPWDPGIRYTFVTFAVDWDRDGDIDLLLGDRRGYVYFFPNESGSTELRFGLPLRLEVSGVPVEAFHGYAAPCVADWDGDGNHDLLLGCCAGNVLFYHNTSKQGMPVLTEPIELIPVSGAFKIDLSDYDPDSDRGGHAIASVADWNGDGLDDLLVGTHCRIVGEQRNLTLPQQAELDKAWAEYDVARREYLRFVLKVQDRVRKQMGLTSEDVGQLRGKYMVEYRTQVYEALIQERNYEELRNDVMEKVLQTRKYDPEETFHGWIWVYLRKSNSQ